jgi:hypothetical protein
MKNIPILTIHDLIDFDRALDLIDVVDENNFDTCYNLQKVVENGIQQCRVMIDFFPKNRIKLIKQHNASVHIICREIAQHLNLVKCPWCHVWYWPDSRDDYSLCQSCSIDKEAAC